MKNILITLLFFGSINSSNGQTLYPKDIIVSTNLTDNFLNRYNIGFEYFFKNKENNIENSKMAIGLNGGIISAINNNQKTDGFNFILETNWYTDFTLPKKWNEYGGLKVSYGTLNNKSINESKNSYFIGIATGVQPIILKKIALKINSDIGYFKNGLSSSLIFNNSKNLFYSGFTVNFNVGLGVRFN